MSDLFGDPFGQKKFWDSQEARRHGAEGRVYSPHRYGPNAQDFDAGARSAGRDLSDCFLGKTEKNSQSTPLNGSFEKGDGWSLLVFFGGLALSFTALINSQNPAGFGIGVLLSTVSAFGLKYIIASENSEQDIKPSSKPIPVIIVEQAINKSGQKVYDQISAYIKDNHLEAYLLNEGIDKLPAFKNLVQFSHLKFNEADKASEALMDTSKTMTQLKKMMDDGTLLSVLSENSIEGRKYRMQWSDFLKSVPKPKNYDSKLDAPKSAKKGWLVATFLVAVAGFGGVLAIDSGFIRYEDRTATQPAPQPFVPSSPTPRVTTLPPYTHAVTAERLNMRVGPGTEFRTHSSSQFTKNECIRGVGRAVDGWQKVAVEYVGGGIGEYYVSTDHIRTLSPNSSCLRAN